MAQDHQVMMDRTEFPPDGIPSKLWFVERVANETRVDEERMNDTAERGFHVRCSFSKGPVFERIIRAAVDPTRGASFFRPRSGTIELRVAGPTGDYRLIQNNEGEIGGILFACVARSHEEALRRFHVGIGPMLDRMSYLANRPLMLDQVQCIDLKNDVQTLRLTMPYADVEIGPGTDSVNPKMMSVYALYREAKNSHSNFYRFLCYYKILEAIFLGLRREVFQLAKDRGIELKPERETIPEQPDLRLFQSHYIGRRVKDLFANEFRTEFRDAVAHFALDSGTILNPSDPTHSSKYAEIILVSELACRAAIEQQQRYFDQLDAAAS